MGNWQEVVREQLGEYQAAGIEACAAPIRCGLNGSPEDARWLLAEAARIGVALEVRAQAEDLAQFERPHPAALGRVGPPRGRSQGKGALLPHQGRLAARRSAAGIVAALHVPLHRAELEKRPGRPGALRYLGGRLEAAGPHQPFSRQFLVGPRRLDPPARALRRILRQTMVRASPRTAWPASSGSRLAQGAASRGSSPTAAPATSCGTPTGWSATKLPGARAPCWPTSPRSTPTTIGEFMPCQGEHVLDLGCGLCGHHRRPARRGGSSPGPAGGPRH